MNNVRASPAQGPVLPATVTAGISEPGFGPTVSVPFPLCSGSLQKYSRSGHIFRVCCETFSSRYCHGRGHARARISVQMRSEACVGVFLLFLAPDTVCRGLLPGAGLPPPLPPLPHSISQGSLQNGMPGAHRRNGLAMPLWDLITVLPNTLKRELRIDHHVTFSHVEKQLAKIVRNPKLANNIMSLLISMHTLTFPEFLWAQGVRFQAYDHLSSHTLNLYIYNLKAFPMYSSYFVVTSMQNWMRISP